MSQDGRGPPGGDDTDDFLSVTGTEFTLPPGSGSSTFRSPGSAGESTPRNRLQGRAEPFESPEADFQSVISDDAQSIQGPQSAYGAGSVAGAPSVTSTAMLQEADFQFDDFSDEEETYEMPSVEDAWKESIRSELSGPSTQRPGKEPKRDPGAGPSTSARDEDEDDDSSVLGAPTVLSLQTTVAAQSTIGPSDSWAASAPASVGQALASRVLDKYSKKDKQAAETQGPAAGGARSKMTAKQRFRMAKLALQAGRAVEKMMVSLDELRALPAQESAGAIKGFIIVDRSSKGAPVYKYFHQEDKGKDRFLLAARRYGRNPMSHKYCISIDPTDVSRAGSGYYGSVVSNAVGSRYTIFDRGPKKSAGVEADEERRVLASVYYDPTVTDTYGGYRKMSVIIPNLYRGRDSSGNPIVERWDQIGDLRDMNVLTTKVPDYKKMQDGKYHYCYKWGGRVKVPSTKNVQLVLHPNQDAVVLLFGKMGENIYACDYTYPLSAHQAFSIAMTAIDSKLCMAF